MPDDKKTGRQEMLENSVFSPNGLLTFLLGADRITIAIILRGLHFLLKCPLERIMSAHTDKNLLRGAIVRFLLRPVCRVLLGLVVAVALGRSAWGDTIYGPLPAGGEKTLGAANGGLLGPIWWGTPVRSSQPTSSGGNTAQTSLGEETICPESPAVDWQKPATFTTPSLLGPIWPRGSVTYGPQPSPAIGKTGQGSVNGGTTGLLSPSSGYQGGDLSVDLGTGGTTVQGGTLCLQLTDPNYEPVSPDWDFTSALILESNPSLPSATSLVVRPAGTLGAGAFSFDPSVSASETLIASPVPAVSLGSPLAITAVPEPNTLVLLTIAAGSAYFWRRRRG